MYMHAYPRRVNVIREWLFYTQQGGMNGHFIDYGDVGKWGCVCVCVSDDCLYDTFKFFHVVEFFHVFEAIVFTGQL